MGFHFANDRVFHASIPDARFLQKSRWTYTTTVKLDNTTHGDEHTITSLVGTQNSERQMLFRFETDEHVTVAIGSNGAAWGEIIHTSWAASADVWYQISITCDGNGIINLLVLTMDGAEQVNEPGTVVESDSVGPRPMIEIGARSGNTTSDDLLGSVGWSCYIKEWLPVSALHAMLWNPVVQIDRYRDQVAFFIEPGNAGVTTVRDRYHPNDPWSVESTPTIVDGPTILARHPGPRRRIFNVGAAAVNRIPDSFQDVPVPPRPQVVAYG